MRMAAILLALATPVAFAGNSISEEFAAGFGGVRWGTDFIALLEHFPGGSEEFSTAPGHLSYVLNIEDPVLGLPRSGQHVVYGMGADGKVEAIGIQVSYDQTPILLSTIESRFGPAKDVEIEGVTTTYRWPSDHGVVLSVRTTSNPAYGLTVLGIGKVAPMRGARPSTGKMPPTR